MHALAGTQHDTGLDTASLSAISSFWEHTRALYAPFESDMKSPSTDVYQHEMPGGQYTNLKFQVCIHARLPSTQVCHHEFWSVHLRVSIHLQHGVILSALVVSALSA